MQNYRTLILNADRIPLSTVSWKKAIKRLYDDDNDVDVIEYYDAFIRDSQGREHPIPAVIANRKFVKRNYKKVPFSRANVYKRDGFRCQYCLEIFTKHELTLDHVVPRSMWSGSDSPTCWHNLVASCYKCNSKKANRTPEQANMQLRKIVNGKIVHYKRPKSPDYVDVVLGSAHIDINNLPKEWKNYIEYLNPRG